MQILVCVKQIPDPDAELHLDQDYGWLNLPENLEYKMNGFDEYAVEEAIRIKQKHPDTEIRVVTVGPERAREVLQRALGMGADQGTHLLQQDYVSSSQAAELLGRKLMDRNFDLILTGAMSEDNMQGLLAPLLAERMQMPVVNGVVDLEIRANSARIKRELEGGYSENFQVSLPAILSLQSGINTPRYPALSKLLKAKQAEFETVTLDVPNPREKLHYLQRPGQIRKGDWLEGDTRSKAEQLAEILKRKNVLSL